MSEKLLVKYSFIFIILILPHIAFSSDFSDWVSGYAEEVSSLGSEVRGCVGSTTTSFKQGEELKKCEGNLYSLPDESLQRNLTIDQLSKYIWIENKFKLFLEELSKAIEILMNSISFLIMEFRLIKTLKKNLKILRITLKIFFMEYCRKKL